MILPVASKENKKKPREKGSPRNPERFGFNLGGTFKSYIKNLRGSLQEITVSNFCS